MGTPVVPITLGELRQRVFNITSQTAVFSDDEIRDAINHGYQRIVRAIRSVRPHHAISYVDNFSLNAGQSEYDISTIDPPIWRLTKLVVPSVPSDGNVTSFVGFEYKDMRDPEFETREHSGSGVSDRLLYDVLRGRLPVRNPGLPSTTEIGSVLAPGDQITVGLLPPGIVPYVGQEFTIVGAGPARQIEGDGMEPTQSIPTDYFGRIVGLPSTTVWDVSPRLSDVNVVASYVTLYQARMLKLAPAPGANATGRLYYLYRPERLQKNSDAVDDISSEHSDAIVAYAAGWLLRSTNDPMSDRWMLEGQEMRSELMQDVEPLSGENSEALSTGLGGLGDW